MSIPKAVLRQAELSDRLLAEQSNSQPADPGTTPVTQEPAPQGSPEAPTPTQQPEAPETVAEVTAPQPTAPAAGESAEPGEGKRVDWKQKYLVLDGKYRAEVPRYAAQVRELTAKVQERDSKIIALHEDNASLRKNPQAAADVPGGDDDFDPLFLNKLRAEARKAAEDAVGQRVKPLEERAAANEHATAVNARATFEQEVTDYVHDSHNLDWRTVDTQPAFHAFLADRDPLSGVQRQLLLNDAVAHADAIRAAAIFQDFLNRTRATRPVAPALPAVDPRAHLVTPARGNAGAPVTEAQKATYTADEVRRFYADYAKASVNTATPPATLRLMEAKDLDIQHAGREGRVRG